MYGLDDPHICVQDIQTRSYQKTRVIDFKPYGRQRDPCTTTTAVYHAQRKHKRKLKARHILKKIPQTAAPPKTREQATKFPDAPAWSKAHDAEFDQLDRMHVIDWKSTTQQTCSGIVPPGRYWSDAEGVSVVAVDYNASNLARRVAVARPKRTMDDATPEDGN